MSNNIPKSELDKKLILIVDDDDLIRELLERYLTERKLLVLTARDVFEAKKKMSEFVFDLVILDVMMPGKTGFDFLHEDDALKASRVIFLSAMGETMDRIKGLKLGASDYLPKPFEPEELYLRINNLLMIDINETTNKIFRFGNFVFELNSDRLYRDEELQLLTSAELSLLKLFIEHVGKVITRDELANYLGGINTRSVDVQVVRLRNKIEAQPKAPRYLQTHRGVGYIFKP